MGAQTPGQGKPWRPDIGHYLSVVFLNVINYYIVVLGYGMANDSGNYPLIPIVGMVLYALGFFGSIFYTIQSLRNGSAADASRARQLLLLPLGVFLVGIFAGQLLLNVL